MSPIQNGDVQASQGMKWCNPLGVDQPWARDWRKVDQDISIDVKTHTECHNLLYHVLGEDISLEGGSRCLPNLTLKFSVEWLNRTSSHVN